ncbi:UDP-N-acetylmuramoyl-tripeptide--D-alanyl-D-alanine ligase [Candidatus Latescibacterota bacterium]
MQQLLTAIGVDPERFTGQLRETRVAELSTDSRCALPGEVFFAIRGERFDGASFVGEASKAGAVLAVVNASAGLRETAEITVAVVDDTVEALGQVAADYRSMFHGTVVAVTGTNGKTTVKEMLLAVLGGGFRVHGTKGNFNNRIGLPLSIAGLDRSHDCAVFELGMSAPGEIAALAAICRPDIGVILNVGPGHTEFFENIEAIADAKMELLATLSETGTAVINGDDELLKIAGERRAVRVIRFGLGPECEYRAGDIVINPEGCFTFRVNGDSVNLNIPGFHSVYNALAAYAVARELGLEGRIIAEALSVFEAPDLRMQRFVNNGISYINDTYNANPVSMKAAAEVLKLSTGDRKIAVLGDMLELGVMSEQAHRDIGEYYARAGVDILVVVGKFADLYAAGALGGGLTAEKVRCFQAGEDAAVFLNLEKRPGDLILVKGSRALKMERLIDMLSEEC